LTNYIYEVTDGTGFSDTDGITVTDGPVWVKYLGTTTGDGTDYRIISSLSIDGGTVA